MFTATLNEENIWWSFNNLMMHPSNWEAGAVPEHGVWGSIYL